MSRLIYKLDEKPKTLHESIGFSIQHVISMFSGNVATALVMAPLLGMNLEQESLLISLVIFSAGISTLIQLFFGSRLPLIQGSSIIFVGCFIGIIESLKCSGESATPQLLMQYITGAIILGGIAEMIIGYTGLITVIKKFFSPIVIGPVIILIGLSIFEFAAPKAGEYWPISILVIFLIIIFSQFLGRKNIYYRIYSILIGVILSYLICVIFSFTGIFESGHPCYVSFTQVNTVPWIQNPVNFIFPWGMPKFNLLFFISILIGYFITIVETIADFYACSYYCETDEPDNKLISKGIGTEGLACALTGVLGGFANTSYNQNIALIGLTGVASRFIIMICGIILILVGLFSKVGVLIASIPTPIVGATFCVLFGMIVGLGVEQFKKIDLDKDRNVFIIGFSILMSLSIPAYFKGVPMDTTALKSQQCVQWMFAPHPLNLGCYQPLADFINMLGKSPLAIITSLTIFLDNVIPDRDKANPH